MQAVTTRRWFPGCGARVRPGTLLAAALVRLLALAALAAAPSAPAQTWSYQDAARP